MFNSRNITYYVVKTITLALNITNDNNSTYPGICFLLRSGPCYWRY